MKKKKKKPRVAYIIRPLKIILLIKKEKIYASQSRERSFESEEKSEKNPKNGP